MIGKLRDKLTFANVMSCVAVFIALSGTAYAAFKIPPNSVGSRQLKAKSVTGGKIADATISGGKIEGETITGANIKLSALGTVPQAANAVSAGNSNTVGGHAASCPVNTTLIRGLCFDASSNTPSNEAPTVKAAAEDCAEKGGWLPTPLELYSVKNVLELGSGSGSNNEFTDDYYDSNNEYHTLVIDGAGQISQVELEHNPEHYICVYPLVR